MEKLGYKHKAYQENKRISYLLDGVEIEIDFWPLIPPYLEVEGKSIQEVELMVEKLGYNMEQTTSINTKKVYEKYEVDLTLPQMALAFVYSQTFLTSCIIGPSSVEQLNEDVGALDIKLSDEVLEKINEINEQCPNPCP